MAEKADIPNDGWGLVEDEKLEKNDTPWGEMNGTQKGIFIAILTLKIIMAFFLLYLFILSLGLMGNAFKILAGKTAGESFRNQDIFDNPFAGLVLGILVTVLVQSSSTSTSIIISMTAAGLMEIKNAIPMIMGANIGTSVTNTIVSIASFGDKNQYRRAFAGATVHDCFNILTVCVMLPIEIITGLLRHISSGMVEAAGLNDDTEKEEKVDFLKKITKPISSRLIQVDKKLITSVAKEKDAAKLATLMETSIVVQKRTKDNHLFMDTPLSDDAAGWVLLIASLIFLCVILILLVKLLQATLQGWAARMLRGVLNLEFKTVPMVGDYVLILFGIGLTILFQSSSITTSTLTPLVGIGIIKLDKMFPFTVGANVGTTLTGILSALASSNIPVGMTVALSHLWFNIIGTLIWFPLPFMRRVPLAMARQLGCLAADLPWFPLAYIAVAFGLIPGVLLALSLVGVAALIVVGIPFLLVFVAAFAVIAMRNTYPNKLPAKLRSDPTWLPPSLRIETPEEGNQAAPIEGGAAAAAAAVKRKPWAMAPVAWGTIWIIIAALMIALPNGQWANLKYLKFDTREHVGIGGWSMCSAQFKKDMPWATTPDESACTTAVLNACAEKEMPACTNSSLADYSTFSDIAGVNTQYESSWQECRSKCSTSKWEQHCKALSCRGSLHTEQCTNITKVEPEYSVMYKPVTSSGLAWSKGDVCRPVSDFCDNSDRMASIGNLGWAGFIFILLGQTCLITYSIKTDLVKSFFASIAFFAIAWILLLASWAAFAGGLGADVSCTVVDSVAWGCGSGASHCAVTAKGKFEEIVNPSYTYGFVVGSWILLSLIIVLEGVQLSAVLKPKSEQNEGSSDEHVVI